MVVQFKMVLYGEMEKDFCPNLIQPFLEIIHGSRKLITVSHDPRRYDRCFPSAKINTPLVRLNEHVRRRLVLPFKTIVLKA